MLLDPLTIIHNKMDAEFNNSEVVIESVSYIRYIK